MLDLTITTPSTALRAIYKTKTALPDPDETELGSASLINNWLCDTGAPSQTTHRFLDLEQEDEDRNGFVEKHPSVHVEVTDGHLVDVSSHGEVFLNLTNNDGDQFRVILNNILYIPGLIHICFSVRQFA
jgi:hypothetical protein